MLLKIKSIFNFSLALITITLVACGGGQSADVEPIIDSSAQVPEIGEALSGNPGEVATNIAPQINSMSLGCDVVTESVAIKIGAITTFKLDVSDESPSTLEYVVSADDPSLLISTVDGEGNVTLEGLSQGKTVVPVLVTDEAGLKNEILINVVVEV